MTNDKQQTGVDYMESVAEELRLNGVENVVINGGTINVSSLGVSMRYDYAHRPNIMADVYRCLSHLGLRIHNVHLSNKLQSIITYGGSNQLCCTPEGQIKRYVNCIGCDRKPLIQGGNK